MRSGQAEGKEATLLAQPVACNGMQSVGTNARLDGPYEG
jgi:hypothetical protein